MSKNTLNYILGAVVVLLIAGLLTLFIRNGHQQEVINELSEEFELEKEALQDDYSQLALQYEDYGIRISNDSLAELLDIERNKNLQLVEEIQTLKINNARRLNELRKELETARSVMRSFVVQIDSLNRLNTRLQNENAKVTRQFEVAQQTVADLTRENNDLTEKVILASKLEARDICVITMTDKGRSTTRIGRIALIEFQAVISKNISAEVGEKPIYMRILQPDDTPLVKEGNAWFDFEGQQLQCSAWRSIEFDGEEQPIDLYWTVEEFLQAGTYRADFFADGYQIGSREFTLTE